jgi:hypothetical protein
MALAQSETGLKTLNGTRIFVSQNGQGEPLVVLHGGPGLNHSYFKLSRYLLRSTSQWQIGSAFVR